MSHISMSMQRRGLLAHGGAVWLRITTDEVAVIGYIVERGSGDNLRWRNSAHDAVSVGLVMPA